MVAIGVDTHKANLAACAIDERGRLVAERSFTNSAGGHRAFKHWLQALPLPRRTGIEGSGSFGAALAQRLAAAGEDVREVPALLTYRERRRTGRPGKSDPADALAIARVVLREERLPVFKAPFAHRDLELLVDYREQLFAEQTRLRNRLHADLEAGRLSVRRALIPSGREVIVSEPKTVKGRRVIALDPGTVEVLKGQRHGNSRSRRSGMRPGARPASSSRRRKAPRSISAIVRPCLRAASAAEVSPLTMLITTAALRFAVQRCTSSGASLMTATSFVLIMSTT